MLFLILVYLVVVCNMLVGTMGFVRGMILESVGDVVESSAVIFDGGVRERSCG
jgi:hypothetical protein